VLGDHVYVACLRGQTLYRLDLNGRNVRKLASDRGRLRGIAVAPDGSLWVTTSNGDQVGHEDGLPQTAEGDLVLRVDVTP
jgi:glucose/arabinose dehydrogenase